MQGHSEGQRELLDAESVAGHLLKPGSVFAFLAEHRSRLFPDQMFADLFPTVRGRPSVPADVMAAVIVLQTLHGLSDSETTDAVTFDLRWKAAIGWPVTAKAFHDTTLTYWRRRLAASADPNRIFTAVARVIAQTGALKGKTRRALDSTVLDDAVATQDTVTQLIAAVRRVRRDVDGAAVVVARVTSAHDYDDPGKPKIAWDDKAARDALIDGLVRDALAVLAALGDPEPGPAADAVALLALIAGQDVELVDPDPDDAAGGVPRWRIARNVAPDRVISVVDPDARHAHKTVHRRQDGFKAHIAVEPDTGLATACKLSKASGADSSDAAVGVELLTGETTHLQVLGDSAYGSGQARATLTEAGHMPVIKPIPLRPAVPGGFTTDDFDIDLVAGTVTCPAGLVRAITPRRHATFGVACRGCPLRSRCTTTAKGRRLKIHEHEALLRAARRQAETAHFQDVYRRHRPMVERSIAWLVRGGNRKVRYRGIAKNDQWLHHRLAGLNLRRMLVLGLAHQDGAWALA
ncbi:MAG: IS1182 family transposase [Actinomycetota bacterium]|nr:IS1182 family transposase [Actinomycetota bacterium]MDQ6938369.1 IS1182 family transposase [Actinomycetota bacterium]